MIEVLMTSATAEERLGLPKNTLAKMRVRGEGPAFHRLGRRIRYKDSDLQAWLKLHCQAPSQRVGREIDCAGSGGMSGNDQ